MRNVNLIIRSTIMLTALMVFVMVESDVRGQCANCNSASTQNGIDASTLGTDLNADGDHSIVAGELVNTTSAADWSFGFGSQFTISNPEEFEINWNGNTTFYASENGGNQKVGIFTNSVDPQADVEIEGGNWVQDYLNFPDLTNTNAQWIASSNVPALFPLPFTGIGLHHQWDEFGSNIGLIERPSSTIRDMVIAFGDNLATGDDPSAATSNRLIFGWKHSNGFNEWMTLLPQGHLGIGTSSPSFQLEITGSAGKPGGGPWTASSDARLKENVKKYSDGLEQVLAIKPVSYQYNGKLGLPTDETHIGILAQDMQEVAPYMIEEKNYGEEGTYLT